MQNFTLLILAVVAIATVYGASVKSPEDPVKAKVIAIVKKCSVDNKATPEQTKIIKTSDLPKTDVEKCYLECVYTGVGVVKDGAFNPEEAKKLSSVRFNNSPKELEATNKVIDICAKEVAKKDDEKCSLGRAVRECFAKNGKNIQFVPSS